MSREEVRVQFLMTCEPWQREVDGVFFTKPGFQCGGLPTPLLQAIAFLLQDAGFKYVEGFTLWWSVQCRRMARLPQPFGRNVYFNTLLRQLAAHVTRGLKNRFGMDYTVDPNDLHISIKSNQLRPLVQWYTVSLN